MVQPRTHPRISRNLQRVAPLLVAIALLLAACTPAIPRFTSPTPTPVSRRWEAPTVLAQLYDTPGYVSDAEAWASTPEMVLFSDGRLIRTEWTQPTGQQRLLEGQLSLDQICGFLIDLEEDGFYDLSASDIPTDEIVTDASTTRMMVNGWQKKVFAIYALGSVKMPAALRKGYERLRSLTADELRPYSPNRIALKIYKIEGIAGEWATVNPKIEWTFEVPITDLYDQAPKDEFEFGQIIVEDDLAQALHAAADGNIQVNANDGDTRYTIMLRPLLPNELLTLPQTGWGIRPTYEQSTTPMDCDSVSPSPALYAMPTEYVPAR